MFSPITLKDIAHKNALRIVFRKHQKANLRVKSTNHSQKVTNKSKNNTKKYANKT